MGAAFKILVMSFGLFVSSLAQAQSVVTDKISRSGLCSTGIRKLFPQTFGIETDANSRSEVLTSLSRAVVTGNADQKVKVNFTTVGFVDDPVNNPNNHKQMALKLKAANSCNVLYVIWDADGGPIVVANKRNDGIVDTCGPKGYSVIVPSASSPVPALVVGSSHTLQADYVDPVLNVYADGNLVWNGTIGKNLVPYSGPVGLRTDGMQFKFDVYTKLFTPLTFAELNVASHGSYPCLPAKPSIQYAQNAFVLEKGKTLSPALSVQNYGGPISSCQVSPPLPTGLIFNSSSCAISGTPSANQSSAAYVVTASNAVGSFSKTLSIRVMTPPTITYPSSFYQLKTTSAALVVPTYAGNAVETCSSDKALPAGLLLSNKCEISGTARSLSARTSYLITAKNLVGSDTKTVDFEVIAPPVLVYSSSSYAFKLKDRVSISLRNNGGVGSPPTSCAIDHAPPTGVTFNTSSCTISGYANAIFANRTFKVTGTNAAGSGSTTISISVSP